MDEETKVVVEMTIGDSALVRTELAQRSEDLIETGHSRLAQVYRRVADDIGAARRALGLDYPA
jgi:hypothetical protein